MTIQRTDAARAYSANPISARTVKKTIGVSGITIRPKNTAAGETAIRNAAPLATECRPSRISASRYVAQTSASEKAMMTIRPTVS